MSTLDKSLPTYLGWNQLTPTQSHFCGDGFCLIPPGFIDRWSWFAVDQCWDSGKFQYVKLIFNWRRDNFPIVGPRLQILCNWKLVPYHQRCITIRNTKYEIRNTWGVLVPGKKVASQAALERRCATSRRMLPLSDGATGPRYAAFQPWPVKTGAWLCSMLIPKHNSWWSSRL